MENGHSPQLDDYVRQLVETTGITKAEALELIYLLGLNWASLVREAKAIKATTATSPGSQI
ncbi:hypothetical protein LB572_06800 [Mesorhizobium sp. BH1-1-5]|uniref:hypothetical protein n=1 Tax=unclassified Mesorhizobium TaxID=325217 RepID=UPI0011261F8D|nr:MULTISPECIES: hypothetical protein [unclassified Mesorhizobium]MBZ9986801.1 hypothetical protein [Mesorhizobium sp. BH1-1-5]TPJ70622.1 hypothetical protein FJ471_09200 [Mesorhizobium sp. B2-7-1]